MKPEEEFIHWLEGFIEGKETLTPNEIKIIKTRLEQVFNKVTPSYIIDYSQRKYNTTPTFYNSIPSTC